MCSFAPFACFYLHAKLIVFYFTVGLHWIFDRNLGLGHLLLIPPHALDDFHIFGGTDFAGQVVHHELATVLAHLFACILVVVCIQDGTDESCLITCFGEDAAMVLLDDGLEFVLIEVSEHWS